MTLLGAGAEETVAAVTSVDQYQEPGLAQPQLFYQDQQGELEEYDTGVVQEYQQQEQQYQAQPELEYQAQPDVEYEQQEQVEYYHPAPEQEVQHVQYYGSTPEQAQYYQEIRPEQSLYYEPEQGQYYESSPAEEGGYYQVPHYYEESSEADQFYTAASRRSDDEELQATDLISDVLRGQVKGVGADLVAQAVRRHQSEVVIPSTTRLTRTCTLTTRPSSGWRSGWNPPPSLPPPPGSPA